MVQVPKSSVFSRKIVNLFAGMAYGSPDLPTVLRDGKYSCHSIEQSLGVATNKIVNPEIILCSDIDQHTLIVEAKSGANLKPDQLERYCLVNAETLRKAAFTSAASAMSHNLLIVGLTEWQERLILGSALVPSPARVLALADIKFNEPKDLETPDEENDAVDTSGLVRIENSFATTRLNNAFNPLLGVDWDVVPNNFLPVDHESEDWEFAEGIIPLIIAAILNGEKVVSLQTIAESFIRQWTSVSSKYQRTLLDRMRKVLRLATQKRFSSYFRFGMKDMSKDEIRITYDIAEESTSRLPQQLQKLFKAFMDDLNSPQIAILYEE